MNKFKILLLLVLCFQISHAQKNDPIVMTINGHPITQSEFEYTYRKNNAENAIDKKTVEEYAQMFIDYKLKVEHAKAMGLDTAKTFLKEYDSYRNQLAQPYIENNEVKERIARKAYERKNIETEVSHILLRLPRQYFPKDTIAVWNKIMEIRDKIVTGGEDFNAAAYEYSEDPSAKQVDRGGYMNWIPAAMFVDEFEDAMYQLPINEVSQPVRTAFGYHLIKVHNRRPASGEVKVAHIMLGLSPQMTELQRDSVKNVADDIYTQLSKGADFNEMVQKYSTDNRSKTNGGELPWFGTAQYPREFEEGAFSLQNKGDISKPISTQFGYHIIKLIDKKDSPSFEESKEGTYKMFSRGLRGKDLRCGDIERLTQNINFNINTEAYAKLKSIADTVFVNNENFGDYYQNPDEVLFSINHKPYKVSDFIDNLRKDKGFASPMSTDDLEVKFNKFIISSLKNDELNSLPEKNPEFKYLSQEYYDGILLFELMDKEVWSKSQNDNTGLEKFFAQNNKKYTWSSPKYNGAVIFTGNQYTQNQIKDLLQLPTDSLYKKLAESEKADRNFKVKITKGIWAKGENEYVDYVVFNSDLSPATEDAFPHYSVIGHLQNQPHLDDIRGEVINDYQQHLEKELITTLHKRYPVKVNKKTLRQMKF